MIAASSAFLLAAIGAACAAAEPGAGQGKQADPADNWANAILTARFTQTHALIKPQPGESRWREILWEITLWNARQRAAAEGKPMAVDLDDETARRRFDGGVLGVDRPLVAHLDGAGTTLVFGQLEPGVQSYLDARRLDAVQMIRAEPFAARGEEGDTAGYLAPDSKQELRTTTLLKDFPGIEQPATRFPGHFEYNNEANPDFMWLTKAEWRALLPANPRKGDMFPLTDAILQRMCWHHLLPNSMTGRTGDTWGSVGPRGKHGIRAREAILTVEEVSAKDVRLSLRGFVHLCNAFDPKAGPPKSSKECLDVLGYEARLRGDLIYDVAKKAYTRFDIVVLGDMYGEAIENSWFFRPGRNPVGFAFELSSGTSSADRSPPRGNMTQTGLERYLGLGTPR